MKTMEQLFLMALISAHGWTDQHPEREEKYWVTREIGGGFKGGMINKTGRRRLSAKFSDRQMIAMHGDGALLVLAYNDTLSLSENIALFDQLVSDLNKATP